MKIHVVPEPSERWTQMMVELGRLSPGLSDLMRESFHLVIFFW